jgi:hypothetical protein
MWKSSERKGRLKSSAKGLGSTATVFPGQRREIEVENKPAVRMQGR